MMSFPQQSLSPQLIRVAAFLLLAVLLSLGSVERAGAADETQLADISFLEDGKTTKEEVILRLGIPDGQYQGERILTYLLVLDNNSGRGLKSGRYSLVLVFDSGQILKKHALVRMAKRGW
jgi:hypothetical protein